MRLGIPYYRQELINSCGLAALRMLFGFYGDFIGEKELQDSVKLHSFGTYSTDLGSVVLQKGYKTVSYTFHLPIFGPMQLKFETEITPNILKQHHVRPSDRKSFTSISRYVNEGGKLLWEPPKLNQLIDNLSRRLPSLISVNTAALGKYWRHWDNGHYLIVEGVAKNNDLLIIDPDLPEKKSRYQIDPDILLPAWTINSKNSTDYLMVINK